MSLYSTFSDIWHISSLDQARLAEAQDLPHYQNIVLVPAMLKRHLIPSEETLGPKFTKVNVETDSPQSSKKLLKKMSDYRWICYWNRQFKELVRSIFKLSKFNFSQCIDRAHVPHWSSRLWKLISQPIINTQQDLICFLKFFRFKLMKIGYYEQRKSINTIWDFLV